MKNILHLFKRDVQNVSRSVIGLIVVMGYIRTNNLKVISYLRITD